MYIVAAVAFGAAAILCYLDKASWGWFIFAGVVALDHSHSSHWYYECRKEEGTVVYSSDPKCLCADGIQWSDLSENFHLGICNGSLSTN